MTKFTVIGLSYEQVCERAQERSKTQAGSVHVQATTIYAGLDEHGKARFEVGFAPSDWHSDATVATFTKGEQNV